MSWRSSALKRILTQELRHPDRDQPPISSILAASSRRISSSSVNRSRTFRHREDGLSGRRRWWA